MGQALHAQPTTSFGVEYRRCPWVWLPRQARQKTAIDKAQARLRQSDLFEIKDKEQKRQVDRDLEHLEQRRRAADIEIEVEPRAIEALYDVKMTRLSPVGLIVTWPEAVA